MQTAAHTLSAPATALPPRRWQLCDESGNPLAANDPNWTTLRDNLLLREYARTLPAEMTAAASAQACAELTIGGHTDWTVGTREAHLALIKDGAHNPATLPEIAADTNADGWYWTSTPVPGLGGNFFVVVFGSGYVYGGRRYGRRWVRPVRSLSPSGQ